MCRVFVFYCFLCKSVVLPGQRFVHSFTDEFDQLPINEPCDYWYCDFRQGQIKCNDQLCCPTQCQTVYVPVDCCYVGTRDTVSVYTPGRLEENNVAKGKVQISQEVCDLWPTPVLSKRDVFKLLTNLLSVADVSALSKTDFDYLISTPLYTVSVLASPSSDRLKVYVVVSRSTGERRPQVYALSFSVLLALTYWHSPNVGLSDRFVVRAKHVHWIHRYKYRFVRRFENWLSWWDDYTLCYDLL